MRHSLSDAEPGPRESCSGHARRRMGQTACQKGAVTMMAFFMATQWHTAPCASVDGTLCLEEPYPAQGPIEHDSACKEAVLGSGQDSCLCRHLRSRSTRL
jgi:hypothetical protein